MHGGELLDYEAEAISGDGTGKENTMNEPHMHRKIWYLTESEKCCNNEKMRLSLEMPEGCRLERCSLVHIGSIPFFS